MTTLLSVLLPIAGLFFCLWALMKMWPNGNRSKTSIHTHTPEPPSQPHEWPALNEYEFDIVGESHHQRALRSIAGSHGDESAEEQTTAILVPDDSSPHDNQAVRVEINRMTVGHLSRSDARNYRVRLIKETRGMNRARCGALVVGGFILRDGTRASYGVKLDIRAFD